MSKEEENMRKFLKTVEVIAVAGVISVLIKKVIEQKEFIDELYETTDNYSRALDMISCVVNDADNCSE